jgi:16S rRNA (cytosine1407-C5)-methyltransferase
MKRTSPTDKLAKKRDALLTRTAKILSITPDEAQALLSMPRRQSLRINTLLTDTMTAVQALQVLGWRGSPYAWCTEGYTIERGLEAIRDSDLVSNGNVFIQNAASWLPVLALDAQPSDTVLDVCAAPGGKTSHIAARASNQIRVIANDNSRPRLAKMRALFARLGVENAGVTLYDAAQIARRLEGMQFDKILLDAPCSGEGMIQFNRDKDFTTWSVAQIKRLQQLQKRIITQAWQLLAPGGTLVYSTCTMAPEEDEAVIDYLLRGQPDAQIVPLDIDLPNRVATVNTWNDKTYHVGVAGAVRLKPSETIEAFFVCKLYKTP